MRLLLLVNIFIFSLIADVFCGDLPPVRWEELSKGKEIPVRYCYDYFEYLVFNQDTLQTSSECDTCPFKITKIGKGFFADTWEISLEDTLFRNKNRFRDNSVELSYTTPSKICQFGRKRSSIKFEIISDPDPPPPPDPPEPICERTSKIIYNKIFEALKSKRDTIQKVSPIPIELDSLFSKLKLDSLESQLALLPDSIKADPECQDILKLLKYLKDDEQFGFGFSNYWITDTLEIYIRTLYNGLEKFLSEYEDIDLRIECIGYADSIPVSDDGIPSKEGKPRIPKISYNKDACPGDYCKEKPFFIDFEQAQHDTSGDKLPDPIEDNCQLSVVRAYNAIEKLRNLISNDTDIPGEKIKYFYAPYGALKEGDRKHNRKVQFKIYLKKSEEVK